MRDLTAGIEMGGTWLRAVVVDAADPQIFVDFTKIARPQTYADFLQFIRTFLQPHQARNLRGVGLALTGLVDRSTQTMKLSKIPYLMGADIRADLAELGIQNVYIENDVACFTLAESLFGAVRGKRRVLGIVIGTGVGAAFVVDGKIALDSCLSPEWGHTQSDLDSPICFCGLRGCYKNIVSCPALEDYYFLQTGHKLDLPAVFARRETDPAAKACFERLEEYAQRGTRYLFQEFLPDSVVYGGGVSNASALPWPRSVLGEKAGPVGAAASVVCKGSFATAV